MDSQAASVGPDGYSADFSSLPAAADWSTRSITGTTGGIATPAALDAAVQRLAASSITSQLAAVTGDPPASNRSATWSSARQAVQTRPTSIAATLLLCRLVNGLGIDAIGASIQYDFNQLAVTPEQVEGHRAYYSLTGATGTWVVIPEFSSARPGRVTAHLNLTWTNGTPLYLLWADDNGSPNAETVNRIDDVSVTAVPAALVPAAILSQPQSQTIDELHPVTFLASVSGYPTPRLQWSANGTPIPGATNAAYSLAAASLSDNGVELKLDAQNTISNQTYTATSSTVTLTVIADTSPPVLLGARSFGKFQVLAFFSEGLAPDSVASLRNYSITGVQGDLAILSATLDATQTSLLFIVNPMTPGAPYTLSVNDVTDRSAAANRLAAGSQTPFTASAFTGTDVGTPAVAGTFIARADSYDLTSSGTNIFGTADQFSFAYEQAVGNFDVKLQVVSCSFSDVWAKAGLMARESLTPGSRFTATLASPSSAGCFFESRSATAGAATLTGNLPVNYPDTWVRLRRNGDVFTGYAGYDGQNWVQLGTVTLALPANLFVGMAAASGKATQTGTAQFRDSTNPSEGTVVAAIPGAPEALGPSSRNTGLIFSEIMYDPPARDGRSLEFVEIFNAGLIAENLTGYRLSGDIGFVFPDGTMIPAGGFLVLAKISADVEWAYGLSDVLQYGVTNGFKTNVVSGITNVTPTIGNSLNNGGGRLRLRNPLGAVLLEVNFDNREPWPVAADGAGHSLILARPSYGEGDVRAWAASSRVGGSPGKLDPIAVEPLRAVVINEFGANSLPPDEDFVELYNASHAPVDLSGAWLSDDPATHKFRIPDGTRLPERGFISFGSSQLGFALNTAGEAIFLVNSNRTRVIDALTFGAQAPGATGGRCPDGGPTLRPLQTSTRGEPNSGPLHSDIVINELMYDPISGQVEDEYIELYNRGTNAVDVSGWQLQSEVDFTIPSPTVIAADDYLVIAKQVSRLRANYPQLHTGNTVGDYGDVLANDGGTLSLARPFVEIDNGETNTLYAVVNEVTYTGGGRWSQWAHGDGSSLELTDPHSDNALMANWADSDETLKSQWISIDHKELLDHVFPRGSPGNALNEVQVMLLATGEALIDDLEVHSEGAATGPNLVANGTFSSGLTGWLIQGNHVRSTLEPTGPNNPSASLHLRATSGGDNGANRVETDLTAALTPNTLASVKARARWLRGHPDVLLRLHGGGLETVVTLPVPANLGTPGLLNSRRVANAGPAIYEVRHCPVLPAANQPILITARVHDTDGIDAVQLQYRLDPSATLNTLPMRDDGTGGDELANDALYSATMPGLAAGTVVAFRIQAADAHRPEPATTLFPADAPARECVLRVDDPAYAGTLGVYRLWVTAAKTAVFERREGLSNEPVDGTLVYNNSRAIYQANIRFRGSPFIRPNWNRLAGSGSGYAYVWRTPEDEPFLGVTELNTDSGEHGGRDPTALREGTSFKMAEQLGFPSCYQRFVHVVINGITEASRGFPIMLDVQQVNSKYIACWFPDDQEGEIYKIDDWFEYTDTPTMQANKSASLQSFTTTDPVTGKTIKKQARYRWSWEKKANRGLNDDYSSLFDAVDACNAPDAEYVDHMEQSFNVEEWVGELAFRHVVGDWDGYGYQRGKNQFTYRPRGGKFWILPWDLDFSLGCNSGHSPRQDLFTVALKGDTGDDHMPEVLRLYNHPHFRRIFLRTLQRLADGPLRDASFLPVLEARHSALQANGVVSVSPFEGSGAQRISIPAWIQQRRTFILGQLPAATFALTANSVSTSSNLALISGTAPLEIKSIEFNGLVHPITWTSVLEWTAGVPVLPGTNTLIVLGRDVTGNTVPGASNQLTVVSNSPVIPPSPDRPIVFINEWMADNATTLLDPANNNAEDWFEIYNPGASPVDLGGFYLTDSLLDKFRFRIPDNGQYTVPPRGFLLVWADGLADANNPDTTDLHASFSLNKDGEAIGLFAADGTQIDLVSFGLQNADVSMGRCPDGAPALMTMSSPTPHAVNIGCAPQLASVHVIGSEVHLQWFAVVNQRYQIEYKNSLSDPMWMALGQPLLATENSLTASDGVTSSQQRFYRLVLLP